MTSPNDQLTLKKIIGAMLFAAKKPVTAADLKKIFSQTAENEEEQICRDFAKTSESDISAALEQIKIELIQIGAGVRLSEVAGGFRMQTDPECSPWLRQLLNSGRPNRLSKANLETLAIIAYRQPVTRAEIEGVRGVNVDSIVRHLMECQLIKIAGRSDLPGHPMLYGTTQLFLEHFGLQSIDHLPGIEQLRRKEEERIRARTKQAAESQETPPENENDAPETKPPETDAAPEATPQTPAEPSPQTDETSTPEQPI